LKQLLALESACKMSYLQLRKCTADLGASYRSATE